MDKVLSFLQDIRAKIVPFWDSLVLVVGNITGLESSYAQLLTIAFFVYVVLVLLLFQVHRMMTNVQRKRVKKCIRWYDHVRYYVAKAMYNFNQEMRAQGKENKLAHGTRSVLKLEKKDYLQNKKKIFDDVRKLETYIDREVVPKTVLQKINRYHSQIKSVNVLHKVVGRVLVVMTLGMYLLGWKRLYYK